MHSIHGTRNARSASVPEGTKQSQQVKPGNFQARTKVAGDFQRWAMGHGTRRVVDGSSTRVSHGPSIAHGAAQIKIRAGEPADETVRGK